MTRTTKSAILSGLLILLSAVVASAAPQGAAHGITATLALYAEQAIRAVGYLGVFLAMTAESMFLPVPSEAVMPFAGFLVADGTFSLPIVLLVAVLGSLAGSLVSYLIGAWGGEPFVHRFGKYLLLDRRDLEATHRFFERRGEIAIFFSRFIPVVRHLISLPAGAARMSLPRFILFTLLGAGCWDAFLAIAGYFLRDHWAKIMRSGHLIDLVTAILLAALVVWYVYRHMRRIKSDRDLAARELAG